MSRYSHEGFVSTPPLWTIDDQKEFEKRVTAENRDPKDFRIEPLHNTFGGGAIKIHNIVTTKADDYTFNSETKEQMFDKLQNDIKAGKFD